MALNALLETRSGTACDNWGLVPLTNPHLCTISDSSRTEKQSVRAYTHSQAHGGMGSQLNRVRERGSGGQVCKPYTPSRVTKVTKGMSTRLSTISLSTQAFLSWETWAKHSITQKTFTIYLLFSKKITITAKCISLNKKKKLIKKCCGDQKPLE